jgi:1-acyl-sn-glycerol-3-phosphate acyltransferase
VLRRASPAHSPLHCRPVILARLPAGLRGAITGLALGLNTLLVSASLVPPALLKLLVPSAGVQRAADRALNALASTWVAINNGWIAAVRPNARWDVHGVDDLHPRGWYLVSSNHQSWVDILVLQRIFHGHIPFLKFFLKRELIWVPVIGLAWWALDFPFMKRGRGHGARSSDLQTTREACEKFKRIPTSVINFVEGTRFTPAKHALQRSPYQHLLKPKIGGLGIALATMGEQFEALLDVTIVYPHGTPRFWDLLCGRIDAVSVRVQQREIPPEVLGSDPIGDKAYRQRISGWTEQQWAEKDQLIEGLLSASQQVPR